MNNTNRILLLALVVSASILAAPAYAIDGTINFNGALTTETCLLAIANITTQTGSVGGASVPAGIVILPAVSTSLLTTAGQTTGQTSFNIGLQNCVGAASTASTFFSGGESVSPSTYNLINQATGATAATNVELQLLDLTTGQIGQNTQLISDYKRVSIESGSATMPYAVQYFATDTTTAGGVTSKVIFSIDYQ